MSRARARKLHKEFCKAKNATAEAKRARTYARSLTTEKLTEAIARLETPDPTRAAELAQLGLREIARRYQQAIGNA